MTKKCSRLLALAAGACMVWATPARAVIQVDFPVGKIYKASQQVMVGTVGSVRAANRLVDVRIAEGVKGESPGERLRIQVLQPAGLIASVAAGQPVVVFVAKAKGKRPLAIVHLADTWLLANAIAGAKPPAWRVGQVYQGEQSFPGRTVALAAIVRELKAGKSTLLDKVEHNIFRGGVRLLAKLDIPKPRYLAAGDVNGDKKPDVLIDTAGGCRLLLATADGYRDATKQWCPWGVAGGYSAFGDVNGDGRADYLQNNSLWINTGKGFAASKVTLGLPVRVAPLAAALSDATGDGKADALILSAAGNLRVLANPGSPDAPWKAAVSRRLWRDPRRPAAAAFGDWGDDGRPHVLAVWPDKVVRYALDAGGAAPAGYEQLTGVALDKYHRAHKGGLKGVLATTIDINGDGRRDFFLLAADHGLLLVNRGFGAFLVNPDAGGAVVSRGRHKVPFRLTPKTPWAAADLHNDGFEDLLVLAEDGTLYEVSNPPFRVGGGPRGR
jgi:hypothetical protein